MLSLDKSLRSTMVNLGFWNKQLVMHSPGIFVNNFGPRGASLGLFIAAQSHRLCGQGSLIG